MLVAFLQLPPQISAPSVVEHGTDEGSTIYAKNLKICKHGSKEREIAKELSLSIVCLTPLHAACIGGLSAVQGEHENPRDIGRKEI